MSHDHEAPDERTPKSAKAPEAGADDVGKALLALLGAHRHLDEIPRMRAKLDRLLVEQRASARLAVVEGGLHPDRVYTTKEAARFLGVSPGTANNIPHAVVPHRGGKWLGVDLMAHRGELTWEEVEAYKQARRAAVLDVAEQGETRAGQTARDKSADESKRGERRVAKGN